MTQLPRSKPDQIFPKDVKYIEPMRNFAGMIEYLLSWVWRDEDIIEDPGGTKFSVEALPLYVPVRGEAVSFPLSCKQGENVFRTDPGGSAEDKAFEYIL